MSNIGTRDKSAIVVSLGSTGIAVLIVSVGLDSLLDRQRLGKRNSIDVNFLITPALGGLAVLFIRVSLGPGEAAVIDRGAFHNTAVIITLGLAGITVIVVLGVRCGFHIASALSGGTAWRVSGGPRPAAV